MIAKYSTQLKLTPYAQEDIPFLAPLFADEASMRFYLPGMWRTFNPKQLEHLMSDWHDAQTNFVFTIRRLMEDKEEMIGLLNFDSVDWVQKNAEMGIILLPEYRGLGLARTAVCQALKQGFDRMNLHRIFVRIISSNEPSLRLFSSLGFQKEGEFREHVYRDGKYENMVLLGLLQQEFATTVS